MEDKSKALAHSAVYAAVADGSLIRPDCCEICGAACKPEGHHDSYDEDRRLIVAWLCRSCHGRIHAKTGSDGIKGAPGMSRQKRNSSADVTISFRLPEPLASHLRADAETKGVTLSRLIVSRLRASLEPPEPVLRVVCAWYHDPVPLDGLGPVPDGAPLSHGICTECLERATGELR